MVEAIDWVKIVPSRTDELSTKSATEPAKSSAIYPGHDRMAKLTYFGIGTDVQILESIQSRIFWVTTDASDRRQIAYPYQPEALTWAPSSD